MNVFPTDHLPFFLSTYCFKYRYLAERINAFPTNINKQIHQKGASAADNGTSSIRDTVCLESENSSKTGAFFAGSFHLSLFQTHRSGAPTGSATASSRIPPGRFHRRLCIFPADFPIGGYHCGIDRTGQFPLGLDQRRADHMVGVFISL